MLHEGFAHVGRRRDEPDPQPLLEHEEEAVGRDHRDLPVESVRLDDAPHRDVGTRIHHRYQSHSPSTWRSSTAPAALATVRMALMIRPCRPMTFPTSSGLTVTS